MNVIVIGAGKIGKCLISSLREENYDVVVVDIDEQRVDRVVDEQDVNGVLGNGTQCDTLKEAVQEIVEYAYDKKLLICAICAAPSILGHKGYLKDKKATCFPGFEDSFDGGEYTGEVVTTCGNIITGKGCGAGIYFGLEILKNVKDEETMKKVFDSLQCPN